MQQLDLPDRIITHFDQALRTLFGKARGSGRKNPGLIQPHSDLSAEEARLTAGLMRVNHAGEVAAQALYEGAGLTAHQPAVKELMQQAAREEGDHLIWCRERLRQLDSHTSYLDPLWYAGSLAIGSLTGAIGDRWSLGFVVETEHQVVAHLDDHLQRLPRKDGNSRAILEQMREDEGRHATAAHHAGGIQLPKPVRKAMHLVSRIMTRTAYWL